MSRKQITPNSVTTRYPAVRNAVVMLLTSAEDEYVSLRRQALYFSHHFNMRRPKPRDSWELAEGPTVGKGKVKP